MNLLEQIVITIFNAYIKNFRIMQRVNYYTKDKIEILFNSISNIYNLSQLIKN